MSGVAADLGTKEGVDRLTSKLTSVDILINNLGIFEAKSFAEITDEDWLRFFEVNVLSGARLSRFYLPKMLDKNWGRIVFISSESGLNIPIEMIHYGVTKTAQIALARGLAETTARNQCDRQLGLAGPNPLRRRRAVRRGLGESAGDRCRQRRDRVFQIGAPFVLAEAICDPGGSGGDGGLCVQRTSLGHERSGVACGWGCGSVYCVRRIEKAAIETITPISIGMGRGSYADMSSSGVAANVGFLIV